MHPDTPAKPALAQTGKALALLRRAAEPERRHLGWAVVWLVLAAALEVAGPILGKMLIDEHLLPRRLDWPRMAAMLGAMLVTGWVASWLRYLQLVRLSGLAMRSVRRLREWVYGHVLRLPMAFFDRAMTGQLVSRVTNDTEAVKTLYIQVLFVILDSSIVLVGTMAAMAWLDWRLMLIVLALVPAVVAIVWLYQRLSAPAVHRARALRSDINGQIAESIGGMSVLQASNAERRFGARFGATNQAHYKARLAELRANAFLLRPALDLLNVLLLAIVIFSFGQRTMSAVEVGVLYAFISYIARVIEPLIQITMQFSGLQQAVVATARVSALLEETGAPEHAPGKATATHTAAHSEPGKRPLQGTPAAQGRGMPHQVPAAPPALRIRHLSFAYNPGDDVLNDLNLDIAQGAFYGIVGHTGSGKSTLLSLMLRYYPAPAGAIEMNGHQLESIDNERFRAEVGLVPQDPFLLAASARENIDMGRGLAQHEIEAAARAAHAHDFISALEQGYDTELGEGGSRLSTGQKQLIAIARALAGKPRLLLLDEATSHIDSQTEQIVQVALNELRGRVTIVAIAHRLSTIREADQIVVLNHGRIAEAGTHEQLMQIEGGFYQRLYLLQQLAM
ncbi:ABC transporter ATP-binding protein [Massilia glaciei]|uniref:ABC transporter ATP-binding protein n=1 Tax=Massilia glaciei TaxID=1524097 RepID=A0A2U2HL93_9BURK|nr:ABC transporter transmembrane domain-containing protein [Massilia glaciei]PWF48278.1 ABC transporter ATP-binding protein [Massilia glaciei]